jgi:hypothetical protein
MHFTIFYSVATFLLGHTFESIGNDKIAEKLFEKGSYCYEDKRHKYDAPYY